MSASTLLTSSECRAAFDALLAGTHRQLRLYDRDLELWELEAPARHAALRAFCVAGGGRRIECLLDEDRDLARMHPRLMRLLRDFGHVLEIRHADPLTPRPDEAFVLADSHGVLRRPDKAALRGSVHPDDPATASALQQRFTELWQRAPGRIAATPLGLS